LFDDSSTKPNPDLSISIGNHLVSFFVLFWAVTRELSRDVTYTTFIPISLRELEMRPPLGAILTAYSGFRAKLGSIPTEYNQVFVYCNADEVQRAFKPMQLFHTEELLAD